jgi:hypothetical protein
MRITEKGIDDVLAFMEIYYSCEWFDARTYTELEEEFYRLYKIRAYRYA